MVSCVRARSSRIMSSMSNTNGACPKLASTTSPGVCSPTVGYRFGYKKRIQIFKEYGMEYYCQITCTYYNKETFFMWTEILLSNYIHIITI